MAERSWSVPGEATITVRGRIAGRSGPKAFCAVAGGRIVAQARADADYEGPFECRLAARGSTQRRLSLQLHMGNLLRLALGDVPAGARDLEFRTFASEPDGIVQITSVASRTFPPAGE